MEEKKEVFKKWLITLLVTYPLEDTKWHFLLLIEFNYFK